MIKLSWETTVKVFGCLCVAVTVGCLANILYQEEYLPHTQVKAEIFYLHDYDGYKCNHFKNEPWLVVIHNDSKRTIKTTTMTLGAYDFGHSTDLMDGQRPLKSDDYIGAGVTFRYCTEISALGDANPVNDRRSVFVRDTAVRFK